MDNFKKLNKQKLNTKILTLQVWPQEFKFGQLHIPHLPRRGGKYQFQTKRAK
jgi:hypothetical protein